MPMANKNVSLNLGSANLFMCSGVCSRVGCLNFFKFFKLPTKCQMLANKIVSLNLGSEEFGMHSGVCIRV